MKYSIVIIFITIQLFNGIRSDEEPPKVHPCDLVRCALVDNCPNGQYLILAKREAGECCNSCKPYAKLGEKCGIKTGTPFCLPNLQCSYANYSYNLTVCAYAWENNFLPNVKCDPQYCPTYKSCPKNTFLIPNNASKYTCCEQCIPYSTYGDYCDSKQQCLSELKCTNNICIESDACAVAKRTKDCKVITSCPNQTYFLQGDGITRCCDVCLKYAGVDETCNESSPCALNLMCDNETQKCKKLNCELIACSPPKCDEGSTIVYDDKTSCCPYCKKN